MAGFAHLGGQRVLAVGVHDAPAVLDLLVAHVARRADGQQAVPEGGLGRAIERERRIDEHVYKAPDGAAAVRLLERVARVPVLEVLLLLPDGEADVVGLVCRAACGVAGAPGWVMPGRRVRAEHIE